MLPFFFYSVIMYRRKFDWICSLLVLGLFFSLTLILGNLEPAINEKKTLYLAPPPEQIEYFTFGFSESVADSLWIRWIQDNDVCQQYAGAKSLNPLPPNTGEFANPRHKVCDNSWSFKMLDAVTRVSPKFKMPYEAGAITLSVLTEDYEGAKLIFDRGVKVYPTDWTLLYRAAYHYLYDRNDLPRAAELLTQAAEHGAPDWLKLLASRLYSKAGQIELGLANLITYREGIKDNPEALKRVDERIADLQQKLRVQQQSSGDGP